MYKYLANIIFRLSNVNNYDFRFIPFGAVLIYISSLLFSEFYLGSYTFIGHYLRIHPNPYFVDLKILLCGIDAIRDGANPYVYQCGGLTGFFNYPYAWGVFAILPFMTGANLFYIGFSMAALFFFLLYLHINKCDLLTAITYTALLISPSIMLCLERGNCDLIIFILLLSALFFSKSKYLITLLLIFTSILKLFPIGAILSLFNNLKVKIKNTLLLVSGIVISFLFYIFTQKDNILTVSKQTPRPYGGISYGLGEIPSMLTDMFHAKASVFTAYFFIFALIVSLFFFCYYIIKKASIPEISSDKKGTSYLVGAGVFITTCLIGYNWEYRLVFLLFTIPQIIVWIHNKNHFSILILASTIIITWQSFISFVFEYLNLHSIRYHFFSQLFVIFLFLSHAYILFNFFKSVYKQLTTKPIKLS